MFKCAAEINQRHKESLNPEMLEVASSPGIVPAVLWAVPVRMLEEPGPWASSHCSPLPARTARTSYRRPVPTAWKKKKKRTSFFFFLFANNKKKEWGRASRREHKRPHNTCLLSTNPFAVTLWEKQENVTRPVVTSKLFVSIKILLFVSQLFSFLMSTPERRVQGVLHLTLRHL